MGKGKIKDLLSATKDEAIGDFLDSELTPEIVKNAAELVVSEGSAANLVCFSKLLLQELILFA